MPRLDAAVAYLQAEIGAEAGNEILAVVLGLKADQIIGEHGGDEIAMIRHAVDDAARRPWRVQEEADRALHTERAQLRAERQEVIVLNPEQGVRLLKP